ncbi:hypothetical protein EVAR_44190_1 [Eumeta japonica]|uniref:Uncharacterized protein n=1 Tax=Eumeta variegata TaxID=151549 RepID=A0A4C1W283_EUMVA|nr:hypothetical protein EVAR_44190_1 [Eumeta japonica]
MHYNRNSVLSRFGARSLRLTSRDLRTTTLRTRTMVEYHGLAGPRRWDEIRLCKRTQRTRAASKSISLQIFAASDPAAQFSKLQNY